MRNQLLLAVLCSTALITSTASFAQDATEQKKELPQQASANVLVAPAAKKLPVARNGEIIDSVGSGATEAILPGVQTSNGISYITGGVGDEELAEMNAQAGNFNVRILIAARSGEYMSEVGIRITDKQNAEVLKVDSAGPLFYASLPAGTYTVEAATESGVTQKATITAPAKIPAAGKIVIRFND